MRFSLSLMTLSSWIVAAASQQHVDKARQASSFSKSFQGAVEVMKLANGLDYDRQGHRHLEDSWDEGGNMGSCAACEADLAACKELQEEPRYLMVQMANQCTLSFEDGVYKFSTTDMADETWWFSDRPFQLSQTKTTNDFFDNFDTLFSEESGGKPNGAITLVHQDTEEFNGPIVAMMVVAAYSEADEDTGAVTYTYELEQSLEQEAVNPISTFFTDEGGDPSPESFKDCSIFIDDLFGASEVNCVCESTGEINCGAVGFGGWDYHYTCTGGDTKCPEYKMVTGKRTSGEGARDFEISKCGSWYTGCTTWGFKSEDEQNRVGRLLGCTSGMM